MQKPLGSGHGVHEQASSAESWLIRTSKVKKARRPIRDTITTDTNGRHEQHRSRSVQNHGGHGLARREHGIAMGADSAGSEGSRASLKGPPGQIPSFGLGEHVGYTGLCAIGPGPRCVMLPRLMPGIGPGRPLKGPWYVIVPRPAVAAAGAAGCSCRHGPIPSCI